MSEMVGHALCGREHLVAQLFHAARERVDLRQVRAHVMAFRDDALPEINRDPARLEEYAFAIFHDPAAAPEQLHLFRERVRDLHRPHVVPEWRVGALRRVIVQDQEVADPIIFQVDQAVEFVAIERRDFRLRKQLDKAVIAAWIR